MGEAVQHALAGRKSGHSLAIVFLIQEKAGFLAVFKVHFVINAVFADLGLGALGAR